MELFRRKTIADYIRDLGHEKPRLRRKAILALGNSADVQALGPLLQYASQETGATLTDWVLQAVGRLCPHVRTVIFGHHPGTVTELRTTLYSPDLSTFTIPFTRLERVIVNMAHCDIARFSQFANYFQTYIPQDAVQETITLYLSGPLSHAPLSLYNAFSQCRQVTTYLRRVGFGQPPESQLLPATSLWNGDFSSCTLPFRSIRDIVVETSTYDPHLLERFLTYAVNILGGQCLQRTVTVDIVGDPDKLQKNLRNSLTNLCAHVTLQVADEMMWSAGKAQELGGE